MMQLGSLALKSNLFLSPLAGYTNLPFRLTLREIGGLDLCTTDLVNARSLLEKNPKALKLIETRPADRPLAVQLFGSVPEEMRDAAVFLQERGVASIDINMGCPVRKVCKVGGGSAMMIEHAKTAALVKGMVNAVKIAATPTSSKVRARSGAVKFSSSQPRRILAVTGIFTASTMPLTSAAVLSSSVIIAEPPPTLQTLRTGQPMLMSTEAMPMDSR